jgi:hypothetical protein
MTTDTPDDAVPVADVRELLEELREIEQHCADTNQWGECVGYANAANKLEALCADVEGEG